MAVPDYQEMMLPILEIAGDGEEHSLRETTDVVSDRLGLTDGDRAELLPSGRQTTLANRVGWARTYMVKAGLLESKRRGYFRITERGREVLGRKPAALRTADLEQFAEFREFKALRHEHAVDEAPGASTTSETPEELIEAAHQRLRDALAAELLQAIGNCSPKFFERLVVDLVIGTLHTSNPADESRRSLPSRTASVASRRAQERRCRRGSSRLEGSPRLPAVGHHVDNRAHRNAKVPNARYPARTKWNQRRCG